MSKLCTLTAGIALAVSASIPAQAAPYKLLYSFSGGTADGTYVPAGLLRVGGLFYGVTVEGGVNGQGTVFSVTPSGVEKVIYSFQGGSDGAGPWGDLIDVGGVLYGTTEAGGRDGAGTIFKVTTAGVETVLYAFTGGYNLPGVDGFNPLAGLHKVGGALYGTTSSGGGGPIFAGTVFKITPAGAYRELYEFQGGADGQGPASSLINVGKTLYGTTFLGCGNGSGLGTVFGIGTNGRGEHVNYAFGAGVDGADPAASLLNVGGLFYGTTVSGGASEFGTVFSITPAGAEKVLYNFTGVGRDQGGPQAALINVSGTFYGVTGSGYNKNGHYLGTLFSITPAGVETVLHTFGTGIDGNTPNGNLIKVGNLLYGTTYAGGTSNNGTVFRYKP